MYHPCYFRSDCEILHITGCFLSFLLLCLVPSFVRPVLVCRYASPRPATAWYFLTSYKTLWLSPFPDMCFYILINVLWLLVYWIVTSISLTSHFITIILHFVCFACFQTLKSLILNFVRPIIYNWGYSLYLTGLSLVFFIDFRVFSNLCLTSMILKSLLFYKFWRNFLTILLLWLLSLILL